VLLFSISPHPYCVSAACAVQERGRCGSSFLPVHTSPKFFFTFSPPPPIIAEEDVSPPLLFSFVALIASLLSNSRVRACTLFFPIPQLRLIPFSPFLATEEASVPCALFVSFFGMVVPFSFWARQHGGNLLFPFLPI